MSVIRIPLAEVHRLFAAQGVVSRHHYATKCVICGTVQSMASLVAAGADTRTVHQSFGFSCEGRFNGAGQWSNNPAEQAARKLRGCNWSLGGLFKVHAFEVEYEDGAAQPMFEIATPEEAQALQALILEEGTG
jgi:hypothetical protein